VRTRRLPACRLVLVVRALPAGPASGSRRCRRRIWTRSSARTVELYTQATVGGLSEYCRSVRGAKGADGDVWLADLCNEASGTATTALRLRLLSLSQPGRVTLLELNVELAAAAPQRQAADSAAVLSLLQSLGAGGGGLSARVGAMEARLPGAALSSSPESSCTLEQRVDALEAQFMGLDARLRRIEERVHV